MMIDEAWEDEATRMNLQEANRKRDQGGEAAAGFGEEDDGGGGSATADE